MGYVDEVIERAVVKKASEPEFLQAVKEVLDSLRPEIGRASCRERAYVMV